MFAPPEMRQNSPRSSIIAHPLCIFVGTWSLTFLLYSAAFSEQLIFKISDFFYVYILIIGGFLSGYCLITLAPNRRPYSLSKQNEAIQYLMVVVGRHSEELWRRVVSVFAIWMLISIFEVIVSGGLPIIWLLTGSEKTYFDFGISSVHGFAISMLLSSATASFLLYLATKNGKFLLMPAVALAWFIISVTRAYIIGLSLQIFFLYFLVNRITFNITVRMVICLIVLVLFFGMFGDFRSSGGSDALINALARPTQNYPDWLPSGFLWVYLYITSPLNNLLNTITQSPFLDSYSIASTLSVLFPTVIRNILFSSQALSQGDLLDESLNMSGAFVGPYLDFGLIGIIAYSLFIGCISALFWAYRYKPFYMLGYVYVATALFFTLFFNAIFFLPYAFQLILFWWFLRPLRRVRGGSRLRPMPRMK